jgi:hypothetical protein
MRHDGGKNMQILSRTRETLRPSDLGSRKVCKACARISSSGGQRALSLEAGLDKGECVGWWEGGQGDHDKE